MKRVVLMLALLAISGGSATVLADPPKNGGPEVIDFKMGVMVLPFTHRKHQTVLNNECFHCHGKRGAGKIDGWGKEAAHTICIPCHDLEEKGPTECKQCHKK